MEVPSVPEFPPAPPKTNTKIKRFSAALLVMLVLVGLVTGSLIGYSLSYSVFDKKIGDLQTQLANLPPQNATYVSYANTTYVMDQNVSFSQLYRQVQQSVVQIRGLIIQRDMFGRQYYSTVQGSGFLTNVNGQIIVVTNNHVIDGVSSITVTFTDGTGYSANVLGSDEYSDLAVLALENAPNNLQTLEIGDSSSLEVGDPVIAVGNPYGLQGSVTSGIISALGRTISEDLSGTVIIPGVIQTSTPINSGNSGGPLINYAGHVVGITTAIVSESQGLGFAIPSNTIKREIESLVTSGSYDNHPSIDASGTDMTLEIAKAMDANVTYGWLVESADAQTGLKGGSKQTVVSGSTVIIGGDIVTAINGGRVTNTDELLWYLEENTLPGQTVNLTVIRNNETITVPVTLVSLN
jgi:S1-C subfamily serine protease